MKGGCGLHLGLLFLAFVICFSLVYHEVQRPREAARGDPMDDLPVVVLSGDSALAVPYRQIRELGEGIGYLIPSGAEKAVGQQIGARLDVSRTAQGRQAVHMVWNEVESWYEATEKEIVPIRYRRPVQPDSMGLLWPAMVPFVYLALLAVYFVARLVTRRVRRMKAR